MCVCVYACVCVCVYVQVLRVLINDFKTRLNRAPTEQEVTRRPRIAFLVVFVCACACVYVCMCVGGVCVCVCVYLCACDRQINKLLI